jgi:transmembrane sensor
MTLEELFRKYTADTITPGELTLLREMVNSEENRAELERLLAQAIEKEFPVVAPEELDSEAMYAELTQRWSIPVATPRSHHTNLRRMVLLSAVAASVLVLVGVYLFRQHVASPSPPVVAKAPAVIVPAGTKATLTLANGSRIVLDSVANGSLAQQGGTKVIKLDDGRLAYQGGAADAGSGGRRGVDGQSGSEARGDVSGSAGGDDAVLYNEICTPRGGFYQLVLSDGTKVWLDVASSLRFPTAFKGRERSVELTGEAYFEIAPKADQPFFVITNDMKVAALGTAFNVMGYQDEDAVRVTLINGSIKVARGKDSKLAKPGDQVSWIRGGGGSAGVARGAGAGGSGGNSLVVSEPDLQQVLAWKQGEFRFDGLPISAIMRQVARWYDVEVECKGPQPPNQFSGVIPRKKDVGELLTVLEETDEVHFTVKGRNIMVESR